ncbi:hypothetical protein C0993_003510 [Termitomyces sp. T159_Od127]|nr:hypothetical protein C0993_003510 [Termitomyces sp. T159_Od127]
MSTKYPQVVGYTLVQQIGGGGFSTYVPSLPTPASRPASPRAHSVFRAVNVDTHRVAACKLTAVTQPAARKAAEKEMRIHAVLKHPHVLEFLNAVVVEAKHAHLYVPGIYMLMELAAGGDLFDKIGSCIGFRFPPVV